MKTICGLLMLAAAMAIASCASDNVAWNNQNPQGQPTDHSMAYNNTTPPPTGSSAVTPGNTDQSGAQLGNGNDKNTVAASISNQDNRFVTDALAGGMYEINAGQKAVMKSSDDRVKKIAQRMIDDHTKADDQLKNLASRKGVQAVSGPNADEMKMLSKLDLLNGSEFDKEYLSQQKSAHENTIAAFQDEANNGTDKDLRDWAATTLPTLREHLQMINNESPAVIGEEK